MSCDPDATDAEVQVVWAFLHAYNSQDAKLLERLVAADEIWDIAGLAHLPTPAWKDAVEWAEVGWRFDDTLELVEFTSYGPTRGSDVLLRRRSEELERQKINELDFTMKVVSSGCKIERLIGGLPGVGDPAGVCDYTEIFGEVLAIHAPDYSAPVGCR